MGRRGARLRDSLSVADDSPLRDRSFRDQFEHFDERLDRRVRSSEDSDYADSNVGITPGKGVEYWFANEGYLRNIYRTDHPSNFAIAFRGENFYLAPVIDAVRELAGRAKIESQDLPGRRRMYHPSFRISIHHHNMQTSVPGLEALGRHPHGSKGRSMQHPSYGLRRTLLPHTRVNKSLGVATNKFHR